MRVTVWFQWETQIPSEFASGRRSSVRHSAKGHPVPPALARDNLKMAFFKRNICVKTNSTWSYLETSVAFNLLLLIRLVCWLEVFWNWRQQCLCLVFPQLLSLFPWSLKPKIPYATCQPSFNSFAPMNIFSLFAPKQAHLLPNKFNSTESKLDYQVLKMWIAELTENKKTDWLSFYIFLPYVVSLEKKISSAWLVHTGHQMLCIRLQVVEGV